VRRTSLVLLALLAVCSSPTFCLQIVCTTTIVGDVVSQVAGETHELIVLLSSDADPHAFEPTAADLVAIARADVVFLNGATLEAELDSILENASGDVVSLSDELALRHIDPSEHGRSESPQHSHDESIDPHVWFDPTYVSVWVDRIASVLAAQDPLHEAAYRTRADNYQSSLTELDTWIRSQVADLPPEHRTLVTDHAMFGYFASRYGFDQVGTVFPGLSSLSEPSARELATLEQTILALDVPALFVGTTVNRVLAEQVATDTGTRIVTLYTGALSSQDGPAGSYLDLMRYNVIAIVEALSRTP